MIDVEKAVPQLEKIHKQHLEADIVSMIAERFDLAESQALSLYFQSELSKQIAQGAFGIQYLDASYLLEDLIENESQLFNFLNYK